MIFIDNKYTHYYFNITSAAKAREMVKDEYYEKHHIVPDCFYINRKRKGPAGWLEGDPDIAENKVLLTAREHLICHILLIKMTEGVAKSKMVFAAMGMKRVSGHQHRYMNSRLYEIARKEMALAASKLNLGRKHTAETKAKVAIASSLRTHTDETKAKMSLSSKGRKKTPEQVEKMKRHRHTEEAKAKMSAARKGSTATVETREKMSVASKGKLKTKEHAANISKGLTGIKKGPQSKETCLKKSIANKGKVVSEDTREKHRNYKHSDEAKSKIAESNANRGCSDETRAKQRAASTGKKQSPATVEKRLATRRANQERKSKE